MTMTAVARISRISFFTDMTRADAPVLPLGYMLEGVWSSEARWLGLIGRTQLARLEMDRVNFATWPELHEPFSVLNNLFEHGWGAEWGEAGARIAHEWGRSALSIRTSELPGLLDEARVDTEAAWNDATNLLLTRLLSYRENLAPAILAPAIQLQPRRPLATESRTKTALPEAA